MVAERKSNGRTIKRRFNASTYPKEILKDIDLSDKTILITGTSNGIGIETARSLAQAGAHVVMANRNLERSAKVRDQIYETTSHRKIELLKLDLSSLKSVEEAAKEYLRKDWPIHVLILNAGIISSPVPTSRDGFEPIFATNHLGGFYFTQLLQQRILESAPARIVVVSSKLHGHTRIDSNSPISEKLSFLVPPSDTKVRNTLLYCRSKLCNVLFALKLQRQLKGSDVNVYSLHPGLLFGTNLYENYPVIGALLAFFTKPFTKNLAQGASTTVYCATHPDTANDRGRYYEDSWTDEKLLDKDLAQDEQLQDALWERSLELIQNYKNTNTL